jgi:hypothetical protein
MSAKMATENGWQWIGQKCWPVVSRCSYQKLPLALAVTAHHSAVYLLAMTHSILLLTCWQ